MQSILVQKIEGIGSKTTGVAKLVGGYWGGGLLWGGGGLRVRTPPPEIFENNFWADKRIY